MWPLCAHMLCVCRAVDVLGGSAATAMLILNLAAEHWRADPGSAVRHALDLLAALPGRVPQRVPAGASAQVYCRALVSAYGAVLPILHGYFTGGELALCGLQRLDSHAMAVIASCQQHAVAGPGPLPPMACPQHWPHIHALAWRALAALPRAAAALAASIELESTVGDSPLAADARSDLSLMWLYLLESAKHLCEHKGGCAVLCCAVCMLGQLALQATRASRLSAAHMIRCLLPPAAVWSLSQLRPAATVAADPQEACSQVCQLLTAGEAMLRLVPKIEQRFHRQHPSETAVWADLAGRLASLALGALTALAAHKWQQLQQAAALGVFVALAAHWQQQQPHAEGQPAGQASDAAAAVHQQAAAQPQRSHGAAMAGERRRRSTNRR